MGYEDLERDLNFIKKTMEASTRYRNIPTCGYVAAGALGALGTLATYLLIGAEKTLELARLNQNDIVNLALLWSGVFVLTIFGLVVLSVRRAKQRGISAWNSLAARMFLSQVPLIIVAGLLTVGLTQHGCYSLVPAVWLTCYGLISYSFSYFTDFGHKVLGAVFIALGAAACFAPDFYQPILLGLGFGGVHLVYGLYRWTGSK